MPKFICQILNDDGSVDQVAAAAVSANVRDRAFAAYRDGALRTLGPKLVDGAEQPRTDTEVWQYFAHGLIAGIIANIQSYEAERDRAAVQAAPITFTPAQP